MRRPNLFIVGAPRSGTTALYEYLRGHPDIYMSPRKEPHHFATDLDAGGEKQALFFVRDRDEYLALFAGARDEQWVGEGSTTYLHSRAAAANIKSFSPDARILVSLRDPVEMMHSLHALRIASGADDILDFEEALAAEEDRRQGRRIPPGSFHRATYLYREVARFGEQLPRYFDAFGRERVHVILFDDLTRETARTFRETLEFLEIDPTWRPPAFDRVHPSKRTRSRKLQRFLHSPTARLVARRVLPDAAQRAVRSVVMPIRRFNKPPQERAPIRPALRRQLEDELMPDVVRLSELLGVDLARRWWGRPARVD